VGLQRLAKGRGLIAEYF